ncbi:helix-turn-helix domain-containing protein [candidate division KSB1 bacterium]|nr:helix-turn-helix domain-containing protein [candidate division KSB1 bacterium]
MKEQIQLFNSVDAAKILGVNVSTIKRWTDEGKLPCIKTAGGHRKFQMEHLAQFLEQNKKKTERVNLFPIESDSDLNISQRVMKGDFEFLIDYVQEQVRLGYRDRVQQVMNGLYLGQYPLYVIYDKLVTQVLHRFGELWESSKITVTEEHLYTQVVRDSIIRLQGIIKIPTEKIGKAFCMIMSTELHDIALKMVDHVLELRGFQVLNSGQMTPTLNIEKIFELYRPDRLYISSTVVLDLNSAQAEFDKLCYIAKDFGAQVFVGGRGFDQLHLNTCPVLKARLFTFKDVFAS